MIKKPTFAILLLSGLLFSCKVSKQVLRTGTFNFRQKPDEIYISADCHTFLKHNPYCSFVLRVPSKKNNVVEEESYNDKIMYFDMENVFLNKYFKIKDRSFAEKLLEKAEQVEYRPDFLLELLDVSPVPYYTSEILHISGTDTTVTKSKLTFYFAGAKAAFKIIDVKTGEVTATFTINYTPCTKGCTVRYDAFTGQIIEPWMEVGVAKRQRKRIAHLNAFVDNYQLNNRNKMVSEMVERLANLLRNESLK
jgi:hypothetical protein